MTKDPTKRQIAQAREALDRRGTRVAATRGRRSKAFIKAEVAGVYTLARAAYQFDDVARIAGLKPDELRQAIKLDDNIGRAYDAGRADLRQALIAGQVEIALNPNEKPADRTRAFNASMDALGETSGKPGTSVSVAVTNNVAMQPGAPMDGRKYRAIYNKLNAGQVTDKRGETIEGSTLDPVADRDPIRAALGLDK